MGDEKLRAEWFWCDRWAGSSAFLLPIAARGLYREMLTAAWARGARLPNNHEAVQRAVGATTKEWKALWPLVQPYWRVDGDSLVNDTQLAVYGEAQTRNERASSRGKKGAQAAAQARAQAVSQGSAHESASTPLKTQPPSPSPIPPSKNEGGGRETRGGGLIRTSLEREKALKFNAFAGARLDVPHKIHRDFMRLAGPTAAAELLAWYEELDKELDANPDEKISPDIWKWLEARFKPWLLARAGDVEARKFLEGA